jgi:hypothetical protein
MEREAVEALVGAKEASAGMFLSPLRGSDFPTPGPTAYAVGYHLALLRS